MLLSSSYIIILCLKFFVAAFKLCNLYPTGKSTLTDSLVAAAGIIAQEVAGDV